MPSNQSLTLLETLFPAGGVIRLLQSGRTWAKYAKFEYFETPAAAYTRAQASRTNVFVGVAAGRSRSGEKVDLTSAGAVWVDLDLERFASPSDLDAAVDGFPIPPSAVVASGSGQHLYWFLETPYRAAAHDGWHALEAVTRGLARALQADAGWAANKLLRVPGTWNHKYQPPRPCTVQALDAALRYRLADFAVYRDDPSPTPLRPTPGDGDLDGAQVYAKYQPQMGPEIQALVAAPETGDRSVRDQRIILSLVNAGASDTEIEVVFQDLAISSKYADRGAPYLDPSIDNARQYAAAHPPLGSLTRNARAKAAVNRRWRRQHLLAALAQPHTPAELVQSLSWSRKTVGLYLRALRAEGTILVVDPPTGMPRTRGRGRPATYYQRAEAAHS